MTMTITMDAVCLPIGFTVGMGVLAWALWQPCGRGDVWRLEACENEIVALRCALASAFAWVAYLACV